MNTVRQPCRPVFWGRRRCLVSRLQYIICLVFSRHRSSAATRPHGLTMIATRKRHESTTNPRDTTIYPWKHHGGRSTALACSPNIPTIPQYTYNGSVMDPHKRLWTPHGVRRGHTEAPWTHHGHPMVSPLGHHGDTWGHRGASMGAPRKNNGVTMGTLRKHHGGIMDRPRKLVPPLCSRVPPWCPYGTSVVSPWGHHGSTMETPRRHYGLTMEASASIVSPYAPMMPP